MTSRSRRRPPAPIDPVVVGDPRAGERGYGSRRITTRDIEEPERLHRVLDQDLVEALIRFLMKQIILIDQRAIDLPLLLKQRLRWHGHRSPRKLRANV